MKYISEYTTWCREGGLHISCTTTGYQLASYINAGLPVCVTVECSRLADGALPLIAAVHTVQLVVAAVLEGEADGPSAVAVLAMGHPGRPAGKVALRAAHAALLVAARGGTVPVSVTPLLLRVAAAIRAATHTLPRQAVARNAVGGIKAK